jgi:hypothetical protein
MVPPPTRKIACRLTVTYAGFEGESDLLQELYERSPSRTAQRCFSDPPVGGLDR